MDTLRRDHLNHQGYTQRVTSPALDAMAAGGVVFDAHRSCSSWTYPSMLCLLAGLGLEQLPLVPEGPFTLAPLPEDTTLLAQLFAARGFTTVLETANPYLGSQTGLDRGYAESRESRGVPGRVLGALAREDLERLDAGEAPWFLHLHYMDPHTPYLPLAGGAGICPLPLDDDLGPLVLGWDQLSPEEQGRCLEILEGRYDQSVQALDSSLAALLAGLEAEGRFEDTLVVLVSDHGEAFQDHGSFMHGNSLFEEEVAASLIFYQPGNLEPGRVERPSTHADLLPALAAIYGLELPEGSGAEPLGEREAPMTLLRAHQAGEHLQALVDGEDKLLYRWKCGKQPPLSWYRLDEDPGERLDRFDVDSPRARELWEEMKPTVEQLERSEGWERCPVPFE